MSARSLLVLALASLAGAPAMASDQFVIDRSHSDATFQVRHLFSRVRGRFGAFEGTITMDAAKPEASSVSFTIDAASIDTDNGDRDMHLRSPDFFDVEKFPAITFSSQQVRVVAKDRYEVTGTLFMHGVEKTVTLPVSFLGAGKDPWGNERAGF